jgi:hypothetical protein
MIWCQLGASARVPYSAPCAAHESRFGEPLHCRDGEAARLLIAKSDN